MLPSVVPFLCFKSIEALVLLECAIPGFHCHHLYAAHDVLLGQLLPGFAAGLPESSERSSCVSRVWPGSLRRWCECKNLLSLIIQSFKGFWSEDFQGMKLRFSAL